MQEIWRDIEETGGKYQVSSWGKVRNVETGNILAPYENEKGYLKIDLYIGGKRLKRRVNRLVAQAFIPNPYDLPQVNHKDGNNQNNSITNLEWVTNRENVDHAIKLRKGVYEI